MLLLLSPAFAGIDVRVRLQLDEQPPVLVLREFDANRDDDAGASTVFYSADGDRCEVLLDADAVGESTFVAVNLRCADSRGRQTLLSTPNVLLENGKHATVHIGPGDSPHRGVDLDVFVSADDCPSPVRFQRDVFARPGRATYTSFRLSPPAGLTCEPGSLRVTVGAESMRVDVEGRYQPGDVVETRCRAEGVEVPVVMRFW